MYMFIGIFVLVVILALFVLMQKDSKLPTSPDRVVLFFRPSCPACKAFKPVWDDVVASMPKQKFEEVDTDKPGSDAREKYYGVKFETVPAVFLIKNGVATKYNGARTKEALMAAFT